ncbi:hypothetical protein EQV77_18020 [Halobacillus fulvus]|nr:hypothetical protein EQV77_18020 [Halobacillus fulvus]
MLSKWTIYQSGLLLCLGLIFYLSELFSMNLAAGPENSPMLASIVTSIFLISIVAILYLFSYFQWKKKPGFLQHPIWRKLPIPLLILALLSVIAFLTLGVFGPLAEWTMQYRTLLYILIVYFISLLFFFVLSVVYKKIDAEKSLLNQTFMWTSLILIVGIFMV